MTSLLAIEHFPLPSSRFFDLVIQVIERPEHWAQGPFARNCRGERTLPLEDDARSFCARGAIHLVSVLLGGGHDRQGAPFLDMACRELGREDILFVNEHEGHLAVLETLRLARDIAEELES